MIRKPTALILDLILGDMLITNKPIFQSLSQEKTMVSQCFAVLSSDCVQLSQMAIVFGIMQTHFYYGVRKA